MKEFYCVVINSEVPSCHSDRHSCHRGTPGRDVCGVVPAGTCAALSPPRPQLGMLRLRRCCSGSEQSREPLPGCSHQLKVFGKLSWIKQAPTAVRGSYF